MTAIGATHGGSRLGSRSRVTARAERLAGLVAVALLAPTPSSGQSITQDPTGQAPPGWALSLRLSASWDDNVLLSGVQSRSFVSRLSADLDRNWRWRRGHAHVGAWGSGVVFWKFRDLDRVNYGGRALESFRLGPRSTLSLGQSFSSSYTRETDLLLQGGLLLPRAVVRRFDSSLDFSQRLSARTSLSIDARFAQLRFDSAQLVDGSAVSGRLGIARQIGRRSSFNLSFGAYRSLTQGRDVNNYWGLVGGSRGVGQRGTLYANVGVTYSPVQGGDDRIRIRGDAGLRFSAENAAFDLRYQRSVDQAFGLGRDRVVGLASLRYRRTLGRRFGLWTYYGFGQSEDAVDPSLEFDTHHAIAGLNWRIWRSLGLGTGYGVDRFNQPSPAPDVTSQRWIVSILVGEMLTWRW